MSGAQAKKPVSRFYLDFKYRGGAEILLRGETSPQRRNSANRVSRTGLAEIADKIARFNINCPPEIAYCSAYNRHLLKEHEINRDLLMRPESSSQVWPPCSTCRRRPGRNAWCHQNPASHAEGSSRVTATCGRGTSAWSSAAYHRLSRIQQRDADHRSVRRNRLPR